MRVVGVVIAILVLGTGAWFGYRTFLASPEVDPFILQPLQRGNIVQTVSATGTVEPLVKVIVGTQVSGSIDRWFADFNDHVTENFVLAKINADRFLTALEQAKADLAIAEAKEEELRVRHEDAQRELNRVRPLFEQHIASENEHLIAKTEAAAALAALKGATASVEAAQARVNAADVDLQHTIIRSPIDGVVISRNIDVGQTVAASFQTPELFIIANDLTHMQVYANLAESDVGLIAEGMPADFRVDAYPSRTFKGIVRQIRYNATVVDGVVTYVTLIEVSNEDLALRPGMTANVTFEVAKAENVLRIPTAALRFNPAPPAAAGPSPSSQKRFGGPTVYTLVEGRPHPVRVEVGLSDGSYTELVRGDLTEGAEIIVERNWQAASGRRADVTRLMPRS